MNHPILDLESIKGVPFLSKSMCDWMLDCGIYSFHIQNHISGVTLEVEMDGDKKEYTIVWTADAQSLQKSMNDFNRTTDYGAMCVSILLILGLTEYTHFETAHVGTGCDFWLYSTEGDELELTAKLEISGISKSSKTNQLDYRMTKKKKQVQKSDHLVKKASISIVEFGTPKALLKRNETK
jgi:hypothetical protein